MTMTLAFDEDASATFEITSDDVYDPRTERPRGIGLDVRLLDMSEGYDLPLAMAIAKLAAEHLIAGWSAVVAEQKKEDQP